MNAEIEDDPLMPWLRSQYGNDNVRKLDDGSIALLQRLFTTTAVHLGASQWGWERRFCFQSPTKARAVFDALKSEDDEPEGWIARRPEPQRQ